jgi:Protein kinase domain
VNAHQSVGRYELLREIGHGGTATVYLARQTDLGRLVALKELSALGVADATTARRFVRESRLAGSLNHPNIVTVHDFFEHRATPFIAMEYLERGSLRPVMNALTFAQIAGVIEGLLAGLRHAHERGIVHRDLKPENLMISAESRVKIADFGIAKATDEAQGTLLTATGTTIGTPMYMAPEQAMGREIGPWSDLYAVGLIAFELLADRLPFDSSGTPMAVLLRHVNERPLQLIAVDPSADPRLSDWIGRLLATDPADRTPSAATAWLAFEEIVLDRLGSRWRRSALLDATPDAGTPPTIRMADATAPRTAATIADDERFVATQRPQTAGDERFVATQRPRTQRLRPAADERFVATQRPRTADDGRLVATQRPQTADDERFVATQRPQTPDDGRLVAKQRPRKAAAAVAWRPGDGRLTRRLARLVMLVMVLAVAIAAGLAIAPGDSSDPAGAPAASPAVSPAASPAARSAPTGVGDSQSDDPSDDEPDGGEP